MSTRELKRAGVLARVTAETLTLGVGGRVDGHKLSATKRLYGRDRAGGAVWLRHRSAGRASNRGMPGAMRAQVLALVREKCGGTVDERFGPTLAAEHLATEGGITVDHETLRRWMLAAGLWAARGSGAPTGADGSGRRTLVSWRNSMAVFHRGSKGGGRPAVC